MIAFGSDMAQMRKKERNTDGKENGGKGTEAQRREKKREMRLIRPEAYNLPLRRARSVRSGASALTHSV